MSKKKKKSVLSKKEWLIIICVAVIVLITIIAVVLATGKRDGISKNEVVITDLDQDLTSVEEVVTYLESDFISMENSKADNYDLDIYVSFKHNLYDGETSQELYFSNFYEKIALVTNFKSFRLIDTSKGITIEVSCNSGKISEVKINGDINYFKKTDSDKSKDNVLEVETLELEVNSSILQNLINEGWNASNVSLGTAESKYNKYDIYFDEGYEIRSIRGRVYNIVFNKTYNQKVVAGYKPGDSLDRIEASLGTSYKDSMILGYKTKDFYIYYSADEISVYPNYKYDYTEFENLVKEYDKKNDINDFSDKLTDIWSDYDRYSYDQYYFEIDYTLKGVKVEYNSTNPAGIQIYENYKGDFKEKKENYRNLYYKLNKNLIIEKEETRLMQKGFCDNSGIETDPIHYSNRFYIEASTDGEYYKDFRIKSLDKNYPNNELDETIRVYKYVWADDLHLIYSINGQGIYIYDAEKRTIEQIVSGKDSYDITNYDRSTNIIEYDGKQAKIIF